jgi:hypothetical protein
MQQTTYELLRYLLPMEESSPRPSYDNSQDLIVAIKNRQVYSDCTSLMYIIYYIEYSPNWQFTYWPTVEQLIEINSKYDIKYIGINLRKRNSELLSNYLTIVNKGLSIIAYNDNYLTMSTKGLIISDLNTLIDYQHVQMIMESVKTNNKTALNYLDRYYKLFGVMPWL